MTITAILAFMSILTKFVTDTDLARQLAEYRGQPSFRDNCAAKYKATSKFVPNYVNVRFSSKLLDMLPLDEFTWSGSHSMTFKLAAL